MHLGKTSKNKHLDEVYCGRNQGNIEEAETKMQEVNEAYEVLSDEELRAKYDRGEDLNPQGGGGGGPQHNFFRQVSALPYAHAAGLSFSIFDRYSRGLVFFILA